MRDSHMKWRGRKKSSNVEDRRGKSISGKGIAGLGGVGIIIMVAIALITGNPTMILEQLLGIQGEQQSTTAPYTETEEDQELADFVSVVLNDTEAVWSERFEENGMTYKEPTLVLYTDAVQTACGFSSSAVGPFYCPGDQKLYIDLSFYNQLKTEFNASGDFAMAYVIAHEVGHHVQTLLGKSKQLNQLRQELSQNEFNEYSVRFELQADYYAGVWAHHVEDLGYLEQGDIEEALNAATAVGDDTIQKRTQGYVVPDSFTHGTAEQRRTWFQEGYEKGTIEGGQPLDLDQ